MSKRSINRLVLIISTIFIFNATGCSDLNTNDSNQNTPTEDTSKEPIPEPNPYMLNLGPMGISHRNSTATTITFEGCVDIDMLENYDMNNGGIGFLFCPSSEELNIDKATVIQINEVDADGKFSKKITSLRYNTEYKYAIFLFKNSICQYSESKTFKTNEISISLSVNNISSTSVDISTRINGLTNNDDCKELEIGICYSTSTSSITSGNATTIKANLGENSSNLNFTLKNLYFTTTYYYSYYIKQNGDIKYGTVNKFLTADPYVTEAKNLDIEAAYNLSSNATANCYIISEAGLYKFKTVKGNSNTSVGDVVSCALIWESYGTSASIRKCDLIDGIFYRDGYIAFQTRSNFKEGNAVIAAKDSRDNILWSWHIWLTDTPKEQVYYNNAGTMMDRNLGATSTTPGDVTAFGLFYQWGRKDPFLGSSTLNSENPTKKASSTIEWPFRTESTSTTGRIEYSIQNPTRFIYYNKNNYDWFWGSYYNSEYNRWKSIKTIYDPCPIGWRVPNGGENGIWKKANPNLWSTPFDEVNRGVNFSKIFGDDANIWYPMAGHKSDETETLMGVGGNSYYWSVTRGSTITSEIFGFYEYSYDNRGVQVKLTDTESHAHGYSVRCQKE